MNEDVSNTARITVNTTASPKRAKQIEWKMKLQKGQESQKLLVSN